MSTLGLHFLRKRPQPKPLGPAAAGDDPEEEEQRYREIDLKLLKRTAQLLKPYKKQYALGVALGTTMVVLEMLSPKFVQWIIDYALAFTQHTMAVRPTTSQAILHVLSLIGRWAAVLLCAVVLQRFTILIMTRAGETVQMNTRRRLFAHLQELSMSYYDKTKLGRIISRCTSDLQSMREVTVWGLFTITSNLLMMLVAAIMLATTTDIRLFLAVAWLGPVLFIANRIFLRISGAQWQTVREGWTRVATNMAENITGMRVVTAFHRQEPNLGAFNRLQDVNTSNNYRMSRINGTYQPLLQLIGYLGRIIILCYGGYLIVTGGLSHPVHAAANYRPVGAVVAAYLYWDFFMNPIVNFGNFYNILMQAMAGSERIFSLLDLKPDVHDLPDAKPLPHITGRVTFENVTFGYNADRPVLHDVSFEAEPGRTMALVGHTGSGKSSIISLIARFYQPQQGRVLVDGIDIRHATGDSLHRQMGLVLQVNYLFTGAVIENIRYAKPGASDAEVIAAAQAIGAHDAIEQLPHGYQTEVGERGANMSLGQRQLICFARAFLADPRIFMLDEATSAVDTVTELLVQRSLERLLQGRTTFIVAHRLSTIQR
ncbi:MAG TPA: ABC transporter ATP-binding protein, partial [Tepidisphaeraceae bacterium]|nr:ABC transporter ATP-binding protein [Tepidisphaeraceae bacterium]